MRVGIIGDGIAGRTLYRLLNTRGFAVEIYGEEKFTNCQIRPCGFGTSASCIELISGLGISPKEYVLRHDDYILMNGRRIRGDLYWIDKPKLLGTLATNIRYSKPNIDDYDIVVDATGVRRTLRPDISNYCDKKGIGCQYRVILNGHVKPAFDTIKGGYLWTIPLGESEAHVGGGSVNLPTDEVKGLITSYLQMLKPNKIICSCSEPIRLSGPIFPMTNGKIINVGESAGLVVPFGGAGIHTAFESAIILAEQICKNDVKGYEKAIRKHFGRLSTLRRIVDDIEKGRFVLLGLGTAYWALRYEGLKPTLRDLLYIRRSLIATNKSVEEAKTQ